MPNICQYETQSVDLASQGAVATQNFNELKDEDEVSQITVHRDDKLVSTRREPVSEHSIITKKPKATVLPLNKEDATVEEVKTQASFLAMASIPRLEHMPDELDRQKTFPAMASIPRLEHMPDELDRQKTFPAMASIPRLEHMPDELDRQKTCEPVIDDLVRVEASPVRIMSNVLLRDVLFTQRTKGISSGKNNKMDQSPLNKFETPESTQL
jgi:hypothetical protein